MTHEKISVGVGFGNQVFVEAVILCGANNEHVHKLFALFKVVSRPQITATTQNRSRRNSLFKSLC